MWQADGPTAFIPWCRAPGCVTLYGKKQSAKIVKIDLQYRGFLNYLDGLSVIPMNLKKQRSDRKERFRSVKRTRPHYWLENWGRHMESVRREWILPTCWRSVEASPSSEHVAMQPSWQADFSIVDPKQKTCLSDIETRLLNYGNQEIIDPGCWVKSLNLQWLLEQWQTSTNISIYSLINITP